MVLPLSLPLAPSVDVQRTPFQVGKGLIMSNLIRTRNGLIQKLAGCTRLTSMLFTGICRCLFPFQDFTGDHYLAVGTNQYISIYTGTAFQIIQPIGHTSTGITGADISTVVNLPTVTIDDGGHDPAVGTWINIVNLTYINGIYLQGPYQVETTSSPDFTITGPNNATATGSGASVLQFTTTNGSATVDIALIANLVPNPTFSGAASGSPGTDPTNMNFVTSATKAGLTVSIAATGTDGTTGNHYIRVSITGTANGGGVSLYFTPFGSGPGIKPSTGYTGSVLASLFSGSLANFGAPVLSVDWGGTGATDPFSSDFSDSFGPISGYISSNSIAMPLTGTLTEYIVSATSPPDANNFTLYCSTFGTTNGGTVNATFQFELPSMEPAGGGFVDNQTIIVGVSTAVGGLTLVGPYTVSVIGNTASINGGGLATSTATVSENSGNTEIQYFVKLPSESAVTGAYGQGLYGEGPYGIGSGISNGGLQGSEPGVQFALEWSMDKWGEDLVFCWITSTVYLWTPPWAPGNVGVAVSGAPDAVSGLFVAAPQQQTMAWGVFSGTLGEQDPLLVGWSDVADLTDWTASATNQAGSFRLSSGNLIISGTWFGVTGLFWTDIDLWSMTYIGFPLVYGFNKVSPNCGLIARRAWATLGTLAVWMSQNDFFVYQGGSVVPLPCSVRDFVFDTLDTTHLEEIHADTNSYGAEVTWWFPQIGSNGQCTGAVKWHAPGGEWDITSSGLSVSAWCDQSVLGPPIGSFYSGLLEQFETSTDFDGQILDSFIISGFFQIAEAEEIMFVERVYPDLTLSAQGMISMTFSFADDFASAELGLVRVYGPYVVTNATPYIIVRGRGRVMQVRLDANLALNTTWRYGEPAMTASIDGRKS